MSENILHNNFFELFDAPVSFDVDLPQVQQRYMSLQSLVHPDKFVNASDGEKRLSMQQTSHINEALQTLKDPVLRATYLLKLKGLDINLENETTMDMAFLMAQMDMREAMERVKTQQVAATISFEESLDVLDDMRRDVTKQTKTVMSAYAQAYQQDDLETAREWIRKLQFLQKAKNEISALSANIEDEQMK